jgi:hypothetical protein
MFNSMNKAKEAPPKQQKVANFEEIMREQEMNAANQRN